MSTMMIKKEAHKLIDLLPPKATWEDLMHEIYVREAIERGLADSNYPKFPDSSVYCFGIVKGDGFDMFRQFYTI